MSKIMIVDDNRDIVDTLKTIMEIESHQTIEAYNGEEFLGKVEAAKPDLVLLDVMMPGLKTKDILASLKDRKIDVKIILVTVVRFSDDEKKMLMKEFNIKDYITKPFEVPELVARIRAVL